MAELKEEVRSVVSGQKQYPVKSKPLWVPGLEQLVPYVESALRENYSNVKVSNAFEYIKGIAKVHFLYPVQVSVVDCPDLTQHGLPAPGLGGEAKLVEGGGEPFNHDTDYNRSQKKMAD